MPRTRRWTDEDLIIAVARSRSMRDVARLLGVGAGGNTYKALRAAADRLELDLSRFPKMENGRVTMPRPWSDEELREIVAQSTSLAEVARQLGYRPSGGIHRWLVAHLRRLDLDTSHFLGQGWAKGKARPGNGFKARPLSEVLVENSPLLSPARLLTRLAKEGIKQRRCEECGIDSWQGKPLTLQLDHVNGNHGDNRLENLRVLCPNCHSQTPTWCARNRGKKGAPGAHPTLDLPLADSPFPSPAPDQANMEDGAGVLQRQRDTA